MAIVAGFATSVSAAPLASSGPTTIDGSGNGLLYGVACPSTSQCTAVDDSGHEVTFNPVSPGSPTPTTIDGSVSEDQPLACLSTSQCTAVGLTGNSFIGPLGVEEMTFNPASPGSATPTTIDGTSSLTVGPGAPTNFSSALVACPSTSQCTVVDYADNVGGAEVTFNPNSPGSPTPKRINSNLVTGVACPSTSQCTAVNEEGQEVTFNPASPGNPTPTTIGVGGPVACPSTSQCTAVDDSGREVTFNPNSPGSPTPTPTPFHENYAVACPSTSQCTVVGPSAFEGLQVTFNPMAPGSPTPTTIDSDYNFWDAVACPSTSQCTAVDEEGQEVTFDPVAQGTPPGCGTSLFQKLTCYAKTLKTLKSLAVCGARVAAWAFGPLKLFRGIKTLKGTYDLRTVSRSLKVKAFYRVYNALVRLRNYLVSLPGKGKYGPLVTKLLETIDKGRTKGAVISAVFAWGLLVASSITHADLKQFVGYFDHFVRDFADLAGVGDCVDLVLGDS